MEDQNIIKFNKELSIYEALFPIFVLVCMLAYNISVFGDSALGGSNQFILFILKIVRFVGIRNVKIFLVLIFVS